MKGYQIETHQPDNTRPVVARTVYTKKESAEAVARGMMKDYTDWGCGWTVEIKEVEIAEW